MIAAVLGLWTLDYFLGTMWFYYLLVAFLVGRGAWEFYGMAEARGSRPHKYLGLFCILMMTLISMQLIEKIWPERESEARGLSEMCTFAAIAVLVVGAFAQQMFRRDDRDSFADMAATFFGVIYLGFLGTFFIKIRHLYHDDTPHYELANILFVVLVLLGTKGSDIAAFFAGRKWGRHKLIPHISPKKSWEGAIASIAFGAVFGLVFGLVFGDLLRFKPYFGIIFGVVLAFAGLAGDLAESLIKRKSAVKDAGQWIPMFGGLLDVIDAPLFGAPAAYYLWLALNNLAGGCMRPLGH